MSQIRNALIALGLILAALGASTLVALAADFRQAVRVYSVRFSFRPGPWFGERIAASLSDPDRSCLIVGASTAREGFDPKELQGLVPHTAFYNGGTTGGNASVLEIQAAILAHYGLHYRCILVPMHPWLFFSKEGAVPDLAATEYVSQLDLRQLRHLSFAPLEQSSRYPILETLLVPFMKHATQVNRIIRSSIYKAHVKWFRDEMPRASYELYADELKPAPDTNYNDIALDRDVIIRGLEQGQFYDPAIYGHQEPIVSLDRALRMFRERTDNLILVRMPDSTLQAAPNRWTLPSFNSVVTKFDGQLTYIDCSAMFPDEFFIDSTHLTSRGRFRLSAAIGAKLNEVLR